MWILLMHCFLCFSYAAKMERGTTISSDAIVRQRRNDHMRFKRILNVTDLSVISIEDHDAKYPFIVGVKTKQHLYDGKNVKTTVRCTGTMITSQLVLTTGYCVRNAITIKVYKHDNPVDKGENEVGEEVKIRTILDANEFGNSPDLRIFPNPLFYGDIINRYNKWYSLFPRDDSRKANLPQRNVAIVYLENPLHNDSSTPINYPIINASPTEFVDKNASAEIFGWCQMGAPNDTHNTPGSNTSTLPTKAPIIKVLNKPRLTMAPVQVTVCDIDRVYEHNLCIDKTIYKNAFCELDQGGPIFLSGDKGSPAKPNPRRLQVFRLKSMPRQFSVRTTRNKITATTTKNSVAHMNKKYLERQGNANDSSSPSTPGEKSPSRSLIGMVNTHRAHGHLTYLWPYADWIYSVVTEYDLRPTAVPDCETTLDPDLFTPTQTTVKSRIESYYDYLGVHGDSKQVHKVEITCHALTVVPNVQFQIAIIIAYVIGTMF